jgi:hypothetical protein
MYWELAELFEGVAEFWLDENNRDGLLLGTYDLDDHEEYDEALDRFYNALVKRVEASGDTLMIWIEVRE